MHIRELQFTGFFEDQPASSSEKLDIVAPDGDIETDLLAWCILATPTTIEDDPTLKGYGFTYRLGRHLDEGIYVLELTGVDTSGQKHVGEIAAALVAGVPSVGEGRNYTFSSFWLLRRSVHFHPEKAMPESQYDRPAYGRLAFDTSSGLPHRRLIPPTA